MKFKATSDFRNTHKFKVKDAAHPLQISKGDVFEADETDPQIASVLQQLNAAGRIIDVDNQKDAGLKIDAEVAAAKAKEASSKAEKK